MRPYYIIKDRETGKRINDMSFSDKMEAKKLRNKLNKPRPDDFIEGTPERFYISTINK